MSLKRGKNLHPILSPVKPLRRYFKVVDPMWPYCKKKYLYVWVDPTNGHLEELPTRKPPKGIKVAETAQCPDCGMMTIEGIKHVC